MMKKLLFGISLAFVLSYYSVNAAGVSSIYFSPATQTVNPSQSFSSNVVINPSTNRVTAVELHLTFDPAKIHVNSVSPTGVWNVLTAAQINNVAGTASIVVGVPAGSPVVPVTTISNVVTVGFQTVGGAGTITAVNFDVSTQAAALGEAGNVIISRTSANFTIDGSQPVLSNGGPTGQLASGTTQTSLVVTTSENATCKYSTTAGQTYAGMPNTFSTTGATSHSKTINGLVDGQSYNYYVRCQDATSNQNDADYFISFSVLDLTAPTLTQSTPVPNPTRNTTPSYTFISSKAGDIDYSGDCSSVTSAAVVGSNTITFGALGAGTHNNCTITVTDVFDNVSAPLSVNSFTIDLTDPTVSITAPAGGITVAGSVSVSANASDNLAVAGVQFKLDGSNINAEDTSAPFQISWDSTGASNGSHTITAIVRDGAGNTATSAGVAISVDNAVPTLSLGGPSGNLAAGTTSASLVVTTNENATCKYSTSAGTAYGAMTNAFSTTGATGHSVTVSGLNDGATYHYYVRCSDIYGNQNSADYGINFSVTDNTAPIITEVTPVAITTNLVNPSYTFNSSEAGNISYAGDCSSATAVAIAGSNTIVFNTLGVGSHTNCAIRVTDAWNNPSLLLNVSDFTIDTSVPIRGVPTRTLPAGTTEYTLTLGTNKNSTCKYSTTDVSYGLMATTFSTTGALEHSTLVTGLESGESYTYYVRCKDQANNINVEPYQISITVLSGVGGSQPVISNVTAGSLTTNSAVISWTTDLLSDSQIEYGLTNSYGTISALNSTVATSHSQTINGLAAGTLFHYRVYSTATGTQSISVDNVFTTVAAPVSSGGGGGGGVRIVYLPAEPATSTTAVATQVNGQAVSTESKTNVPIEDCVIAKNAKLGDENESVRRLQEFLNSNGYPVSVTGVGSKGKESNYFGAKTKSALKKYQTDHFASLKGVGFSTPNGELNSVTRTFINGIKKCSIIPVAKLTFVRNLKTGDVGADVKKLQQFLNNNGFILAESGQPGSVGNETTKFGAATRAGLKKFQTKNKVISKPDGVFGTATRAFANNLLGS